MNEADKLTKNTIAEGGVLALLYFDIHGTSVDVLKNLSAGFVQQLLNEQGVVWVIGEIDEPISQGDLFSTSTEVKILTKSFLDLVKLCAKYSPFSVEILEPNEINLSLDKAHELLLTVSTVAFDYKKYIVERLSKPEDLERYRKSLEHKIELGKRLLEKKQVSEQHG
jgi:hypothetical protein